MRRTALILTALAALVIAAACHRRNHTTATVHHGVGVVESIDKELSTIQINHEEIKDYMPAMSMPYRVRRKSLLDAVQPGDKVEFTIRDDDDGIVLTHIKKQQS